MPGLDGGPFDPSLAQMLGGKSSLDWGDLSTHKRRLAESGLWLLAGDLDRSHTISQSIDHPSGSFWHGIMHRREGDFGNSHYWFHKVGHHPAMDNLNGYDGHGFIDEVADPGNRKQNEAALIKKQQDEWMNLFCWCANQ